MASLPVWPRSRRAITFIQMCPWPLFAKDMKDSDKQDEQQDDILKDVIATWQEIRDNLVLIAGGGLQGALVGKTGDYVGRNHGYGHAAGYPYPTSLRGVPSIPPPLLRLLEHVKWDTHCNLRFNVDTFPNKDKLFTSLCLTVLVTLDAVAVSALNTATKLVKWGQWWSQEFVDSHPVEREWWNRPTGKTSAPRLVFKRALVGACDTDEALNDIGQGVTAMWEAIVQYIGSCESGEMSEDVGITID
ncbi:hypothetical protein C8Q80DRAFT_1119395 [Daedaleopsis nitida]|nr:hypothetical protein C8Q80DRAFT_1119395 [Daedaleopsis nitida]